MASILVEKIPKTILPAVEAQARVSCFERSTHRQDGFSSQGGTWHAECSKNLVEFRETEIERRMNSCHSPMTNARAAPERLIRIAAVNPNRMPLEYKF
jgi:hypothetical protein